LYIKEQKRYLTFKSFWFSESVVSMQAVQPASAGASDVKILLDPDDLPKAWYNILPDLPAPFPPYLHPGTKEPVPPQAFEPLFPKELIRQEMSANQTEPIPEELREAYYRFGRPTPLYRATRLEAFLKTPAKIYYKREDLSPVGSHKPNTAIAQAYFAAKEGIEAYATETGAGQWGSALALATNYFGMRAKVFMVRVSYDQKPYRKYVMRLYGAEVIPSPSDRTNIGKKILAQDPDHPGSLGVAISEAIETAVTSPNTRYSLGSVLNHVLMHQTVIGLEARKQFELADVTCPLVDKQGCVVIKTNAYSVPIKAGTRVEARVFPSHVEIWHSGRRVARHERCYRRRQHVLDLEHYLDVLSHKPGAFAGSKPLAQWRAAGRGPACRRRRLG